ncbi:MAG: pre-peptidase C-terminal domain-containing protein, partial [Planctomycetaceae bacterium]|nr:pre-peptidase C-terminal domain-containing protein [Planctomycetaceae bacterium]
TITSVTTIENLALLDEADYFRFELTTKGDKDSYVRIGLDYSLGDLDLQLFNSSKKSVKSVSTVGNAEKINLNGLAAGIYYIRVYGYKQATNPSYTLTINPPSASITSSPVTLSGSPNSTSTAPTLTGDYQIYANNSAVTSDNSSQQNGDYAYSNLSNQFFSTPPSEILAIAPVIEIIGYNVNDEGKISLQWTVKNNDDETPTLMTSEIVAADANDFQISATYNYFSNGKTMTGVVKSNVYSLQNIGLLQKI